MKMPMLLQLFWIFFKIGLFTIGGGYAMIPMITDQVVSRGWLTLPQLIDFIAVSESTPGPFAINIATFIGMENAGIVGALSATLGVVLPSFIVILIVANYFYDRFVGNFYVQGALSGIRPAVLGLISSAAVTVLLSALFGGAKLSQGLSGLAAGFSLPGALILAVLVVLNLLKKDLHPIVMIIIAAGLGILLNVLLA